MQHWQAFPWVRYVLWLICGMLLFNLSGSFSRVMIGLSLLSSLGLTATVFWLRKNTPPAQILWGLMAFMMLSSVGYWRTSLASEDMLFANPDAEYWWVRVEEQPVETPKRFRFQALVWDDKQREESKLVQVYVSKEEVIPQPGQLLLIKGRLQQVPAPLNPYEFDYSAYMASLGINYQLFATDHILADAAEAGYSFWKKLAQESRAYLLEVVKEFVPKREAAAVVKAMVLGQRTELDIAMRQAYANAGVMHVLAVSGLHVGMVYGILYLLFSYMQRSWERRFVWLLLVLLVLWSYALLTGLAPSALRATVMFSIVALGKAIKRRGNIYNSIALSACVLLVWDPLLLEQVGFQLSYLAVVGIVYLQPRISSWYQPKQPWLKKIWELLAVTLAAQLASFPLGLYYFHQFPTYFFIGNLLAVPLAFLILYGTLILLLLHWLPLVNGLVGIVVSYLAQGLNFWVQLTDQLPSSRLIAIITAFETVLLYLCILSLIVFVRLRNFKWGVLSFCLLMIFGMSGLYQTYQRRNQEQLIIYQIPGHTLLHLIEHGQEALIAIGESPGNQQLQYHVEPTRLQAGLQPMQENNLQAAGISVPQTSINGIQLLVWQGIKVAVIDGQQDVALPKQRVQVDILLLRKSPKIALEDLEASFAVKVMVLDASNTQTYRQRIKSEANLLALPFYLTSEKGAYHLRL